jgi:hypothetical protein
VSVAAVPVEFPNTALSNFCCGFHEWGGDDGRLLAAGAGKDEGAEGGEGRGRPILPRHFEPNVVPPNRPLLASCSLVLSPHGPYPVSVTAPQRRVKWPDLVAVDDRRVISVHVSWYKFVIYALTVGILTRLSCAVRTTHFSSVPGIARLIDGQTHLGPHYILKCRNERRIRSCSRTFALRNPHFRFV